MDARHQGKAYQNLTGILLFERRNNDAGLHRLVFKICNGAVYADAKHLNYLLLRFSRGVANFKPVMHPIIYITVDPRTSLEFKT